MSCTYTPCLKPLSHKILYPLPHFSLKDVIYVSTHNSNKESTSSSLDMLKLRAYRFPLDGLEEGVGHDLHEASLLVTAQTVSGVLVEEALED